MSQVPDPESQPPVVLAKGYVSAIRDDTDMERPLHIGDVLALLDSHEALRAALDARVECWSCPDCAFTFDAFHTDANGGYSCPACVETGLRAALATAEAERDTWKAYAARVAQEARDNFGVAEAAEESREWWRTARSDAISLDLKALVERVGVLEAALRWALDALANDWELGEQYRAARAVLGDQGVPDTETPTE